MKHFSRFLASFLVVLLLVSLFACAPNSAVSEVMTTPEVASAPTATPTATPAPTATPVPTLNPEDIENANQRFADFLNSEGDFSDEKIKREVYIFFNDKDRDLGYIVAYEDIILLQGILLYNEQFPNGQMLAVGIKDRGGERKIVVFKYTTQYYVDCGTGLFVVETHGRLMDDIQNWIRFENSGALYDYLRDHAGQICRLSLVVKEGDNSNVIYNQNNTYNDYPYNVEINYDVAASTFISGSAFRSEFHDILINTTGSGLNGISDIESFFNKLEETDTLPSIEGIDFIMKF